MTTPREALHRLRLGASTGEVTAWFDALEPVLVEDLRGPWRGREIPTGHSLAGLLGPLGWHGKRFDGPETVHPLVFEDRRGRFAVDPSFLPVRGLPRLARTLSPSAVAPVRHLLRLRATSRPQARLRMMQHRGVLTATMVYDRLPIHDHFRRVDADTVVGAMDLRGVDEPFFFSLRRETRER